MHILYTTNPDADVKRHSVRNPHYFTGVERGAEAVTVQGDFPAIVQAYQAAGIDVEDPRAAAGMTPEPEARALVIADLQVKGIDHDSDASIHELQALNITPQDGKEPAPKPAKQPKAAKQPAEPQDGKE